MRISLLPRLHAQHSRLMLLLRMWHVSVSALYDDAGHARGVGVASSSSSSSSPAVTPISLWLLARVPPSLTSTFWFETPAPLARYWECKKCMFYRALSLSDYLFVFSLALQATARARRHVLRVRRVAALVRYALARQRCRRRRRRVLSGAPARGGRAQHGAAQSGAAVKMQYFNAVLCVLVHRGSSFPSMNFHCSC